jgi:hypothetical protein
VGSEEQSYILFWCENTNAGCIEVREHGYGMIRNVDIFGYVTSRRLHNLGVSTASMMRSVRFLPVGVICRVMIPATFPDRRDGT